MTPPLSWAGLRSSGPFPHPLGPPDRRLLWPHSTLGITTPLPSPSLISAPPGGSSLGWAHQRGGMPGPPTWGRAPHPAGDGPARGAQQPHSDPSAARRTRCAHPRSACSRREHSSPVAGRVPRAPSPLPSHTPSPLRPTCQRARVLRADAQVGPDGFHAGLDIIAQDAGGAPGWGKEATQDGPGDAGVSEEETETPREGAKALRRHLLSWHLPHASTLQRRETEAWSP